MIACYDYLSCSVLGDYKVLLKGRLRVKLESYLICASIIMCDIVVCLIHQFLNISFSTRLPKIQMSFLVSSLEVSPSLVQRTLLLQPIPLHQLPQLSYHLELFEELTRSISICMTANTCFISIHIVCKGCYTLRGGFRILCKGGPECGARKARVQNLGFLLIIHEYVTAHCHVVSISYGYTKQIINNKM